MLAQGPIQTISAVKILKLHHLENQREKEQQGKEEKHAKVKDASRSWKWKRRTLYICMYLIRGMWDSYLGFLRSLKGERVQFLGLSSNQVTGSLQSFVFSCYTHPRLYNVSNVRKHSRRSMSVYCKTLTAKAGLPFFIFPTETLMFIFIKAHAPSTVPSWQPILFCGILC